MSGKAGAIKRSASGGTQQLLLISTLYSYVLSPNTYLGKAQPPARSIDERGAHFSIGLFNLSTSCFLGFTVRVLGSLGTQGFANP